MANIGTGGSQDALRTPLARARGLGSGKTGTDHFKWQRVTAIVLAILSPWLIGLLVAMVGADEFLVRETLARPLNAILLTLFVICLFWHAKLGVQVVIEDYVHHRGAEIALLLLNLLACALGAIASLYAIARIAVLG
jgi:succinate dehydrogenase / fumarate reductase, membrane anchor subunit